MSALHIIRALCRIFINEMAIGIIGELIFVIVRTRVDPPMRLNYFNCTRQNYQGQYIFNYCIRLPYRHVLSGRI